MFEEIIQRFSRKAPAAVLFRSLFARIFSAEQLDEIFRQHKQRQVEGELLFSSLIRLLTPVVSGSKPSVHAAYQEWEEEVGVSYQAVYDKLQGVEPEVSAALVRLPQQALAAVRAQAQLQKPDLVPGYHCLVIDGKHLDGTEHRLKEARRLKSAPLPGTVLALLDTRLELFVEVACEPDAYRCERKIVLPLLEHLERGALYIADRNFCDGPLIERFVQQEAYFLLRHHGRSPRWREAAGSVWRKRGQDSRGGRVFEQAIEVELPDGTWYPVRRIRVELKQPTRDQEEALYLLTNLPASVSTAAASDGYGGRWTIETCLGHVSQTLNAELNTLAYPQAGLLCFCLALTLYNLLSTLEALLVQFASAADKPPLSHYYLALEIVEARLGLELMIDAAYWERYARMSLAEYVAFAASVARQVNLRRYRKHPRGPKRPQPKRRSGKGRSHVSAHRLLATRKR